MVKDVYYGKTLRKSFARHEEVLDMPNLLEIQKKSYQWFLDTGLQEVFRDVAAIGDYAGNLELSFIDFTMDEKPKYSVEECKARDATYAAPLKVRVRLRNKETEEIKEQEIFMGDFPLMTKGGTFVINGAERVIVSQIVRSPGVYYARNADKADNITYAVTVIPYRGAWLEYETDLSDIFNVRIDKNRKLPVTCLIRAVGPQTDSEILELFGEEPLLVSTLEKDTCKTREEAMLEIYRKLRPGEPPTLDSAESLINSLFFDARRYDLSAVGRYKFNKKLSLWPRLSGQKLAAPVADPRTGEIIAEAGQTLTRAQAQELENRGVSEAIVDVDGQSVKVFSNRMVDMAQFVSFDPEACGITEKVRFEVLCELLDQFGQDEAALKEAVAERKDDLVPKHIIVDDMMASINYLCSLSHGVGTPDDIDHLGNRRLRCVGELLQNQFRIGFSRMERVIRERMTIQDLDIVTPQSLINIRPVTAAIKEFFGSSPLSQFMDQTNPLAELTHKRRMSALGPGGLSRDRASFDVRDVHYSHYGRMCPIETPEGPNIGLISYLATYARINRYGFIEAPYRKVDKQTGFLTNEVEYMTADIEDEFMVGQATEPVDENGCLANQRITCRHRNEIVEVDREKVDYIDVSPKMMVSIATAMIPFLENDDANRALMGANMQRQAVPLLTTQAPIVATGMEHKNCIDSEIAVLAEGDGEVTRVSATNVTVRYDGGDVVDYPLIKFLRSNHGTCINQRPIVSLRDRVKKGDVIADGPSTNQGEISLGKNILMGFMTWEGYNYEDAILLNERMVKDDVFTSIHIEEYETEARDTKLGPEEITRDIPNVGDKMAGRHGNKGVVSRIMPQEDMPFLPDGTPLDIVLNPLGVPSRMNIGQVLEVHLGRAAQALGWKVATPVFNGADEKDIMELLAQAGLFREVYPNETIAGKQLYLVTEDGTDVRRLDQEEMADAQQIRIWRKEGRLRLADGKTKLYDGRTGEMFENPVTVGYVYFLKLHHLVDDKIHARSTGPYSLVTQQPLGGKAQFGGQRFGEMEVWALEAYGAAYTLQEILTVKSDDVTGRVRTDEAIVKGHNVPSPGIPESFKVLVKELQALCLDIKVLDAQGEEIELRDDEEEGYQNINQIRDDDYEPYREDADAQFSAAGYTIKESSDDDDLTVGDDSDSDTAEDDYGDGDYEE